uniref:FCH and mu domain containing endocytic adaptor 1 n=1 Tax=Chelydra serpentina TaxID=8475 RepID=A0A8C3XLL7_CHESE
MWAPNPWAFHARLQHRAGERQAVVPAAWLGEGEKNQGFDVLYHNMKHGQVSTKELADFVRERATVEETYGKSMAKLAKMATNGTQLGTFAPLWEVFRVSSDKLALCHLELVKKLHDLLREIARYGEEQGKAHKKSKEEVSGTLEAIQLLQGVAQLMPKSKENYHSKCLEAERLRREGTNQKEIDKAERKSKKAAEALRRAVEKYNVARADFEQRMLDSAMRFQEMEEIHLRHMKGLISSYSHSVEDTHVQIGQVHEELKQNVENIGIETLLQRFAESKGTGREKPAVLDFDECRTAPAQEGKYVSAAGSPGGAGASPALLLAGGFSLDPGSGSGGTHGCSSSDSDYEDEDEPRKFYVRIKPLQPCDAAGSGQAAVEQLKATVGNLPLPPSTGVRAGGSGEPLGCSGTGPGWWLGGDMAPYRPFRPPGLSRGPSPVVLGSQDALPVAAAFTEYIHAYFKGQDPDSCLVKITGELTMSFPAGIVRVFSGSPAPPVLSFRLLNTAPIEQFLPSAELLYSDPSQSDPSTKDFWLNMPALTGQLQRQAEQAPAASYYNVALLKYQFSKLGPSATPLQLAVRWDCTAATTQVSVEYGYNAGAMAVPRPLTNVQVLLPVEEPVANVRLQPAANPEPRLSLRRSPGCGHLSASWEPLYGPSKPSPVAAQFTSEGSTLSGVEVELAGSGYRMSLVKKRFATGNRSSWARH